MNCQLIRMRKAKEIFKFSIKLLIGILIISPLLYGFSLSLMSMADISRYPPVIITNSLSLDNYISVFKTIPIVNYFLNSMIVCFVVIGSQIITSSLAAYSFSFFEFKGKKFIFTMFLATMMIPVESIIISNYLTINNLELADTYFALFLPYLASGMSVFLMRQFYNTIPRELKEASVIDGCKDMRFLFSIAFPISVPAIAALGVYSFIMIYNQFFWPLLVTNTDKMRTVQIGISILKEAETLNYGMVLAGGMLVIVPAVMIFIIGQKQLIQGLIKGAIKG